jgi:signal transduction histidine kinase
MKLSFRKRIALFNTMAAAITMAIVFMVIYGVVYYTAFRHLDNDILLEKEEIINTLDWDENNIILNKMPEWEEAEHKKVEVNPTFIQIVDNADKMIFKSANLKTNHFLFNPGNTNGNFYNTQIENQQLRLGQFAIKNDQGKVIGQLTVGVSQQESHIVLNNLLFTLCISFPILLLVLYMAIYFAASKSIEPVNNLIKIAAGINDTNINTRLPLPENEDEIYQLAKSINELLQRIEASIHQQKQFTADASHEIRTPLAAIRGTLEVLLRKNRTTEQYVEKISDVIEQTVRLNQLLDQLLQLARLESGAVKNEPVFLEQLLRTTVAKWDTQIKAKAMQMVLTVPANITVNANNFFLAMMADNLLSNAIKYGEPGGQIVCKWDYAQKICTITNDGPGILPSQIPYLFNRFYRTDESRSSQIPGTGLGLAIVKKLADLQHINISVQSIPGSTTFSLQFPA